MGLKGIDISEHQRNMDVERVVRDNNIKFAFVRTNYGSNHDDVYFNQHADACERGGALVTPYVYPLATDIRGSIDDSVRIIGGRYDRAIVDWEHGSGGGAELRRSHDLLWERGFSTPVCYDPKWYWESVGSPDLSWMQGRVKGHWKSWYADNVPRSFDDAFSRVPGYVWDDNRGGIPTRIVQFTGTGRLPGYGGNLDLNFFPGTVDELRALLIGDDVSAEELWRFPMGEPNPETGEQDPAFMFLEQAKYAAKTTELKVDALTELVGGVAEAVAELAKKVGSGTGGNYPGDEHVAGVAVEAVRKEMSD